MKKSLLFSIVLLLLVVVWMTSGQIQSSAKPAREDALAQEPAPVAPVKVLVASSRAEVVEVEIVVQGQLEPERRLDLRVETAGQVVEIPVRKGEAVEKGQVLLRLAEDDRPARVAQAHAELARQQLNLEGARRLFKRRLQSEAELRLAEASVAAARAALKVAEIDLERTAIRAPFDGVLETVYVELGSFLDRADPVMELLDNATLKAVGHVPQQSASAIVVGQPVAVRLLDGRIVEARVRFISRVADTATRSFRIEAEIVAHARELNAGVSAELHVVVGRESAHFLSPSVLTLDGQGRIGVKTAGDDGTVAFHPVSLVRTQADGVWVSGLPERARVIVQGQGFVVAGQVVEAVAGP